MRVPFRELLCLDFSNQFVKAAVCAEGEWTEIRRLPTQEALEPGRLEGFLGKWVDLPRVVCSVVPEIESVLSRLGGRSLRVRADLNLGFALNYPKPETLGEDRLANLAAVAQWAPVLVVDAGTAVTVDALDANGIFRGGVILPGLWTMASALGRAAAQLPELELSQEVPEIPGTSTAAAIEAGLVHGLVGAVQAVVEKTVLSLGLERPALIATGGDAPLLQLAGAGFDRVSSRLTLEGLAKIATLNGQYFL